jgi:hypothetical protein
MLRILAIGALLGATPAAAQTTIEAHDTRPTLAQRSGLRAKLRDAVRSSLCPDKWLQVALCHRRPG